ncbi:MAG: hypothetical protein RLZZ609_2502 [Cyanobacteriota bacterium]|jgi:hypothetical protein
MNAVEYAIKTTKQKCIAAHIPGHIAGFGPDLLVVGRCDEAALGFLKVALILEWQAAAQRGLEIDRVGRGTLALGVKVLRMVAVWLLARSLHQTWPDNH